MSNILIAINCFDIDYDKLISCIQLLKKNECSFILIGDKNKLIPIIKKYKVNKLCEIEHAIGFESSQEASVKLLKSGISETLISIKDYSFLQVLKKEIKIINGISQVGAVSIFKNSNPIMFIDRFCNTISSDINLFHFGIIANIVYENLFSVKNPDIKILNIYHDESRSPKSLILSAEKYKKSKLNFQGFINSCDLFNQESNNIIVGDGLSINTALNAINGFSKYITLSDSKLQKNKVLNYIEKFFSDTLRVKFANENKLFFDNDEVYICLGLLKNICFLNKNPSERSISDSINYSIALIKSKLQDKIKNEINLLKSNEGLVVS